MAQSQREIDVLKIAALARLTLESTEAERFKPQLVAILDYIAQLEAIDTKDIEATSHVMPLASPLRNDHVEPGLPREEALSQAPRVAEGAFVVPKFVEGS